jgi:hypothetical protein
LGTHAGFILTQMSFFVMFPQVYAGLTHTPSAT